MPIWILEVLIVTNRAAKSDALEASGLRQTLWFSGSRLHPMLMACLSIPNDSAKKKTEEMDEFAGDLCDLIFGVFSTRPPSYRVKIRFIVGVNTMFTARSRAMNPSSIT